MGILLMALLLLRSFAAGIVYCREGGKTFVYWEMQWYYIKHLPYRLSGERRFYRVSNCRGDGKMMIYFERYGYSGAFPPFRRKESFIGRAIAGELERSSSYLKSIGIITNPRLPVFPAIRVFKSSFLILPINHH